MLQRFRCRQPVAILVEQPLVRAVLVKLLQKVHVVLDRLHPVFAPYVGALALFKVQVEILRLVAKVERGQVLLGWVPAALGCETEFPVWQHRVQHVSDSGLDDLQLHRKAKPLGVTDGMDASLDWSADVQ